MLAFEVTPQNAALVVLALGTVGGFVTAFVAKRKGDRKARIAHAAFAGAKRFAADYSDHKGIGTALEDAIYDAAADLNVPEEHIEEHLGDGLAPKEKTS